MLNKPRLCLSDVVWRRIANKIPDLRRSQGIGDRATRRFLEAVLWIWRTGAPWRDLPGYFGKWFTAYKRFRRWSIARAWDTVHTQLLRARRQQVPEIDAISIDSTSVRAHQHGAGGRGGDRRNATGRSRGGRTTKIHAAVSSDKTLVAQVLTTGECADVTEAVRLVKRVIRQVRPRKIIADKAYDSDALIAWLTKQGIRAVIPPRRNRKVSRDWAKETYRQRNVVERFYAHAKQFRRLATRFDKTVGSYRGGLLLVSARYLAV